MKKLENTGKKNNGTQTKKNLIKIYTSRMKKTKN